MADHNKASVQKLGVLHGAIATVLTAQILHTRMEEEFDSEGNSVETGEEVYDAPPATIAAAIKFCKDNAIIADVEHRQNMNELDKALKKKQLKSRLTVVGGQEAAGVEVG